MKSLQNIRAAFQRVPANRFLGFQLLSRSSNEAVVAMEIVPEHTQETGVVHGALLTAVADTASVYVLYPDLPETHSIASIEFKMNFLRPAQLNGGRVLARAKALRRGRNVGVCEVDVMQGDDLVAKGLFTYLFSKRTGSDNIESNLTTG